MRLISVTLATIVCLGWAICPLIAQEEKIDVEKMPEMISQGKPVFPEVARKANITAIVTVRALIDKTGKVVKAEAAQCNQPGYGFEDAAIKAALKSKFHPAISKGKPVDLWVSYNVKFDLKKKK
jgi:protein TonB